jgi:hypothetical protein
MTFNNLFNANMIIGRWQAENETWEFLGEANGKMVTITPNNNQPPPPPAGYEIVINELEVILRLFFFGQDNPTEFIVEQNEDWSGNQLILRNNNNVSHTLTRIYR